MRCARKRADTAVQRWDGGRFLETLDQIMDFEAIDSVAIWSIVAILSSVTWSITGTPL